MRRLRERLRRNPMLKKAVLFSLSLVLSGTILGNATLGFAREPGFVYLDCVDLPRELQEYVYNTCQEQGVEYELVLALMWRESRFQINAVGHNSNGTKDSGLMQINDVNRGWLQEKYGIQDLMDPYQNSRAGISMLADYFNRYGDERSVLMAYHLGEGGMQRKLEEGIYTNQLAEYVLAMREEYRELIRQAASNASLDVQQKNGENAHTEREDKEQKENTSREITDSTQHLRGMDPQNFTSVQNRDSAAQYFFEEDRSNSLTWEKALDAYHEALPYAVNGLITVELRGSHIRIPLEIQQNLAAQAAEDGFKLQLQVSRVEEGGVVARYTAMPGEIFETDIFSAAGTGRDAEKLAAQFRGWFSNSLTAIDTQLEGGYGQRTELAIKANLSGMDIDNLVLYAYQQEENQYFALDDATYRVDENGYIHIFISWMGDIVISEGILVPR